MKTLTILLTFFFIVNISYSTPIDSSKTLTEQASDLLDSTKAAVKEGVNFVDTSSTFKAIYSDVKQGIVGLASALKIGAEHVYKVLVKQQIVYAVTYLLVFMFGVFLSILCYKQVTVFTSKLTAWRKEQKSYSSDEFFHISTRLL